MSLVSVQQLMSSINILDPIEKETQKRHPKNEFQAYAYRLAHDLNDLQNLQIYMRLSKTVERSLMERAYSFVSDSNTNERGRLFLWKLKKLRMEIQRSRDLKNFDYDFVTKKMAKARDIFKESIKDKTELDPPNDSLEALLKIHDQLKINLGKSKVKILVLGYTSPKIISELGNIGYSITLVDISKELIRHLKDICSEIKGSKFIAKDFLKHSFKDQSFDVVFINGIWNYVPFDCETKFLNEVKKVLKNEGKLVINSKASNEVKQEWKVVKYKESELDFYLKNYTELSLLQLISNLELNKNLA